MILGGIAIGIPFWRQIRFILLAGKEAGLDGETFFE
ncbi:hypothetical protein RPHASCH2410_PD04365 (plasmid) [Rhizobium phaseoli Ch24-10]|nr:hypothetical protein RPHASCH2410_PD04365 [Rhizobium phaseoli Ch24-10]